MSGNVSLVYKAELLGTSVQQYRVLTFSKYMCKSLALAQKQTFGRKAHCLNFFASRLHSSSSYATYTSSIHLSHDHFTDQVGDHLILSTILMITFTNHDGHFAKQITKLGRRFPPNLVHYLVPFLMVNFRILNSVFSIGNRYHAFTNKFFTNQNDRAAQMLRLSPGRPRAGRRGGCRWRCCCPRPRSSGRTGAPCTSARWSEGLEVLGEA